MKIKFKEWDCILKKEMYQDGERIALVLVHEIDGDIVAFATTNLPDVPMDDDEVAIKDYAENEGMLKTLIDAGVISQPTAYFPQGFVDFPICKLLI